MADNRGGYRKPENPAPMSGPGALSQRTDGGPAQGAKYISGLPYGQGQETYNQQTAAPMAAGQSMPSAPTLPPMLSLNDETQRPDVQSLLASLTQGGEPNRQASLVRRLPVA